MRSGVGVERGQSQQSELVMCMWPHDMDHRGPSTVTRPPSPLTCITTTVSYLGNKAWSSLHTYRITSFSCLKPFDGFPIEFWVKRNLLAMAWKAPMIWPLSISAPLTSLPLSGSHFSFRCWLPLGVNLNVTLEMSSLSFLPRLGEWALFCYSPAL